MQNDLSSFGRYRPNAPLRALMGLTRASSSRWWGRRRAFFFRSLALKALRGRPIDAETIGTRMRLYPAANTTEKNLAFTPQYFDEEERRYLIDNMREDFIFIDVGADVGGYALFVAAHAGPRARILAIEPQPEVFERLTYNIRENGFFTVKALACAVADHEGAITLFVNPKNSGEASMRIVNIHAHAHQITVQARPLAALVREEGLQRIDAMKIDVEGAEDIVLEPFFSDMPRSNWPTILVVEDAPARWSLDLPALLRQHGYVQVRRTGINTIYRLD